MSNNLENIKHQYVEVNGIKMHYVEQGEGDLVILLHGFPEFWYCWRKQIPALAKHYHVVAPDLRGYNETDKPKRVKDYDMDIIVKDVLELIKKTGHQKAHIISHDWGGAVGYELGMKHPDKVEKLVVMNSPHPSMMKKQLMTNNEQRKKSWYMLAFQIPFFPEFFMKMNLRSTMFKSFRGWAHKKEQFPDEVVEEYIKAFEKEGAIKGGINWYRAAFRDFKKDNKEKRPLISTPTKIIWGENDRALGKELTIGMEKYFTGPFSIDYIKDCSHWVQNEYPEKVNEILLNFLQEKMKQRFKDKIVWVTGASSGIGEAIAKAFAAQGAKLVLSGRKIKELERVKSEINLTDENCLIFPLDITEFDKAATHVQSVKNHFGRIDYLINNAGISQRSLLADTSLEVDKKLMEVNYLGTVALTKAVLPIFQAQQSGHFAVITSLVGKFGTSLRSSYAASKHALHGFFDTLRTEHYKDNISVTIICPGFIKTNVSINALTADGSPQGTMDGATGGGMSAEECGRRIVKGIAKEKEEILVGGKEVIAVYIKRFFPTLFSKMMRKVKVT